MLNLMVVAMDVFTKLFGNLLAFVYHCLSLGEVVNRVEQGDAAH
jgi:hypothetical protein